MFIYTIGDIFTVFIVLLVIVGALLTWFDDWRLRWKRRKNK